MSDDTPALYSPIGEGGKLSGFDERLLEMASERKSGEQMYAELGSPPSLSPARCLQRVREILKAQDYLSRADQKALLLLDFIKLRDVLWEKINGEEMKLTRNGDLVEVSAPPAWASILVRVLREWRNTIDSMRDDVEGEQDLIRTGQATLVLQAITVMFDRYQLREERYFELHKALPSADERRTMFEEVIPLGFQALETKAAA